MDITPSLTDNKHWGDLQNPDSLIGQKGIWRMAVTPLRTAPSDAAEMAAQICYGEVFEVLEAADGCVRLQRWADKPEAAGWNSMQGWVDNHLIPQMVMDDPKPSQKMTIDHTTCTEGLNLPAGCLSDAGEDILDPTIDNFMRVIKAYDGAPYLWGGQTSWGVDCSGLIQSVMRCFGVYMPRDADEQAQIGDDLDVSDDLPVLSTVYFAPVAKPDHINHVGFLYHPAPDDYILIHAKQKVKAQHLVKTGDNLDTLMFPESAGRVTIQCVKSLPVGFYIDHAPRPAESHNVL